MTSSTTYRWIIKIIIMTFRWILLARDYPRARADVNCFGARASVQCKYKVLMFYPGAWRTPILTCLHMSLILRNARAHQPANFFSLKFFFFLLALRACTFYTFPRCLLEFQTRTERQSVPAGFLCSTERRDSLGLPDCARTSSCHSVCLAEKKKEKQILGLDVRCNIA